MAIRLWPKDYEKKDHISKREKGILKFASTNFKDGHLAVGIDPLGLSTDTVKIGMYISPSEGLLTFSIFPMNAAENMIDSYIFAVKNIEDRIYARLLDSKMLIVRENDHKTLKFPYKHVILFAEDVPFSMSMSNAGKQKLSPFATGKYFVPLTAKGKLQKIEQLALFSNVRKNYDPSFTKIAEEECRAIFERLAPEYTVIMNEQLNITPPTRKYIHADKDMLITGNELEFRTFFLDEYQVGLVNDMGKGHRVILANPGAGKSVLLLSKAYKYASIYKDSKILLTCYNNNLADAYNFKRNCADFGDNNNLHIMTFHKLVKKIYEECLGTRCEGLYPSDDEIRRCADYIRSGKVKLRFLAIFIDEVQIFDPLFLEICYLLLEDSPDRVFLLAGDLNQTVRTQSRRGDAPWKKMSGIKLDFIGRVRYIEKNYRNSQGTAKYLNSILGHMNKRMSMLSMINSTEFEYNTFVAGDKPTIALNVKTGIPRMEVQKTVLAAVKEIVKKYKVSYSDIAILFPYAEHSSFKYYFLNWIKKAFDNEDIPYSVITSAGGNSMHQRYSSTTGVVLSTIDSSLGLDFKAVIVAGLHPYNYVFDDNKSSSVVRDWVSISKMDAVKQENFQIQMRKLYTACSRARDILYVISDLTPNTPMEEILLERRG